MATTAPGGVLPLVDEESRAFWTGGARGQLMIMACNACDHRIHPPQLICPACLSNTVEPRAASGEATVASYTINHQPWLPGQDVPYALVIADLDDQPGVRLTARLEGVPFEQIAIGMPVKVAFSPIGDVFLPHFVPR